MTAATVPLQAQYGEVSSTRRSKPALTTAAQRCSWVRMFPACGEEEGGSGNPIGCVFPLTMGVGSTGAHLPTFMEPSGGLLEVLGGSGREKKGGRLPWVLRSTLPSLSFRKPRSSLGLGGGWSSSRNQFQDWPSSSPCPQGGQASEKGKGQLTFPFPAPCRSGPEAQVVFSETHPAHTYAHVHSPSAPKLGLSHLGHLPPYLGSPAASGCG